MLFPTLVSSNAVHRPPHAHGRGRVVVDGEDGGGAGSANPEESGAGVTLKLREAV